MLGVRVVFSLLALELGASAFEVGLVLDLLHVLLNGFLVIG